MALPSAVTIGSVAFVLVSGVGYVAVSGGSAGTSTPGHHVASPITATPVKPVSTPQHSTTVHHAHAVVPNVLVVVFNNTGITGLAEQKAAILQGAGWKVAATDNWYGNIPADTVYYPPALHADAAKLAKVLHITRLHLAVAPMQLDRLTVILATS